jgi:hypothetical protein
MMTNKRFTTSPVPMPIALMAPTKKLIRKRKKRVIMYNPLFMAGTPAHGLILPA